MKYLLAALLCACTALPAIADAPAAAARFKREIIGNARLVWGLDAPIAVLAGQLEQESGFDPVARSKVGALGIAQFMPATARDLAKVLGGTTVDPLNPAWALRAHARYMHDLYKAVRYADECDRMGAALSAYNGGLGRVNKRQTLAEVPGDFWNSVRVVNPGITEDNQRENASYPVQIVFKRQSNYATWGRTVCDDFLTR